MSSKDTIHLNLMKLSPWVILNDFGAAFSMGAVGGGIWHGIKGARNSPRVSRLAFVCVERCRTDYDRNGDVCYPHGPVVR